jgi:hypothetical protein
MTGWRIAPDGNVIFWSLGKGRDTLECSAEQMFDPDPDPRNTGF